MCRVDPEIECLCCAGRMYYDDFSSKIRKQTPIWVCMSCKHTKNIVRG